MNAAVGLPLTFQHFDAGIREAFQLQRDEIPSLRQLSGLSGAFDTTTTHGQAGCHGGSG
jgi:hypothetical protein